MVAGHLREKDGRYYGRSYARRRNEIIPFDTIAEAHPNSMGHFGAVDKRRNFHAKFTTLWYHKKNG